MDYRDYLVWIGMARGPRLFLWSTYWDGDKIREHTGGTIGADRDPTQTEFVIALSATYLWPAVESHFGAVLHSVPYGLISLSAGPSSRCDG